MHNNTCSTIIYCTQHIIIVYILRWWFDSRASWIRSRVTRISIGHKSINKYYNTSSANCKKKKGHEIFFAEMTEPPTVWKREKKTQRGIAELQKIRFTTKRHLPPHRIRGVIVYIRDVFRPVILYYYYSWRPARRWIESVPYNCNGIL